MSKQCLICVYFSPDSDERKQYSGLLNCLNFAFVYYKHVLLVYYCDVFISCLDSHSDGTHSLQRIH